jgi:hypothetical protein
VIILFIVAARQTSRQVVAPSSGIRGKGSKRFPKLGKTTTFKLINHSPDSIPTDVHIAKSD